METYTTEGSLKTPQINFEFEKGLLEIKGRSTLENAVEFYEPLFETIDRYLVLEDRPHTVLNIHLDYFSTTSSKCMFVMFKKFEDMQKEGKDIVVNWKYEHEDDDMLEAGKDFEKMLNLPFNMIPVQNSSN